MRQNSGWRDWRRPSATEASALVVDGMEAATITIHTS
jgi:hypothetical protein